MKLFFTSLLILNVSSVALAQLDDLQFGPDVDTSVATVFISDIEFINDTAVMVAYFDGVVQDLTLKYRNNQDWVPYYSPTGLVDTDVYGQVIKYNPMNDSLFLAYIKVDELHVVTTHSAGNYSVFKAEPNASIGGYLGPNILEAELDYINNDLYMILDTPGDSVLFRVFKGTTGNIHNLPSPGNIGGLHSEKLIKFNPIDTSIYMVHYSDNFAHLSRFDDGSWISIDNNIFPTSENFSSLAFDIDTVNNEAYVGYSMKVGQDKNRGLSKIDLNTNLISEIQPLQAYSGFTANYDIDQIVYNYAANSLVYRSIDGTNMSYYLNFCNLDGCSDIVKMDTVIPYGAFHSLSYLEYDPSGLLYWAQGFTELKVKTFEGIYASSKTIKKNEFSIYPNPTNGQFTLELSNATSEPKELKILSLDGKEVYHEFVNSNKVVIDLDVEPGVYLVSLNDGAYQEVERLIVE